MTAPSPTLPDRLRLATRDLHAAAERSGVMGALLQGRLPHPTYRALLANLHRIYQGLEEAAEANAAEPWLQSLPLARLRRVPALSADLGAGADMPLLEETEVYADRLRQLGRQADPALLAHVYTRYLGDLHGGQILQALVKRQYPDQTTRFMEFGGAAEVQSLRDALRQTLLAAPLQPAQADAVVAEAGWSFEQHRRLFEALAAPRSAS